MVNIRKLSKFVLMFMIVYFLHPLNLETSCIPTHPSPCTDLILRHVHEVPRVFKQRRGNPQGALTVQLI